MQISEKYTKVFMQSVCSSLSPDSEVAAGKDVELAFKISTKVIVQSIAVINRPKSRVWLQERNWLWKSAQTEVKAALILSHWEKKEIVWLLWQQLSQDRPKNCVLKMSNVNRKENTTSLVGA